MFDKNTVVCFGIGVNFFSYINRIDSVIDIHAFSDNNSDFWGKRICGDNRECINPSDIVMLPNPMVIIMVDKICHISSIEKQLNELGVSFCLIKDVLSQIDYSHENHLNSNPKIQKFIDLALEETTVCNFHCSYCVVWRKREFDGRNSISKHSINEMLKALSFYRLGGVCFINICARGETLLARGIVTLVRGLLEEGHYVSIVTNGTIKERISELISLPEQLQKRLFFKISYHYVELRNRNLFSLFWDNVDLIKKSCCSYTLEMVPDDALVKDIPTIKKMFDDKAGGALPHVSYARDSKKKGLDLLSNYSFDEYATIWKQFDSRMFDLKSRYYNRFISDNCYAGCWSYLINMGSGNIKTCYGQDVIGNIYDSNMKQLPIAPVGCHCKMPYCFNNHAFLAWGVVPQIQDYSYLDMRDRIERDGQHWVKEPMRSFMAQKLFNNNYEYIDKWSDYEKLYCGGRKPACILFNSPDYSNVGDIAIAYSERKFIAEYFSEYDIIEISCTQYQKERSSILNNILPDDLIFITGGGNISNLWLSIFDATCEIVKKCSCNTIIIMPQTIYFEDNCFGQKEEKYFFDILRKCDNVIICAREKKTFDICEKFGIKNVFLVPDMALYLTCENQDTDTGAVLCCFREDTEQIKRNYTKISSVVETVLSNPIFDYIDKLPVYSELLDKREETMMYLFAYLRKYRLVITDRLHCMLLCAISGVPCIALDNVSTKVSGSYEWISFLSYIGFTYNENTFENVLVDVIHSCDEREKLFSGMNCLFSDFANQLIEKIKEIKK